MSKKHFIALADVLRQTRPNTEGFISKAMQRDQEQRLGQWSYMREALADFCQAQNSQFKRDRWLGYIAGENGKNGGKR